MKTRQCQSFFLSSRGKFLRSLCRVEEWRLSGCPFSQASVVHNRLPLVSVKRGVRAGSGSRSGSRVGAGVGDGVGVGVTFLYFFNVFFSFF